MVATREERIIPWQRSDGVIQELNDRLPNEKSIRNMKNK